MYHFASRFNIIIRNLVTILYWYPPAGAPLISDFTGGIFEVLAQPMARRNRRFAKNELEIHLGTTVLAVHGPAREVALGAACSERIETGPGHREPGTVASTARIEVCYQHTSPSR